MGLLDSQHVIPAALSLTQSLSSNNTFIPATVVTNRPCVSSGIVGMTMLAGLLWCYWDINRDHHTSVLINAHTTIKVPTTSTAPCRIVFRYDFGNGGLGDCIKGMAGVMQLAHLSGCDFLVDFSRNVLGRALPLVQGISTTTSSINLYNIVDWSFSRSLMNLVRELLLKLTRRDFAKNTTVVQTNVAMSVELAEATGLGVDEVVALGEDVMSTIYTRVINGTVLGTFWPAESETSFFRVAIHLREGDHFIEQIKHEDFRVRPEDEADMLRALSRIHTHAASIMSPMSSPMVVFACGDSEKAITLLHTSLDSANLSVVFSPKQPVHVGHAEEFSGMKDDDAMSAALYTVREHHTLASADVIYMLSRSGFSTTACMIASKHRLGWKSPHCFERNGDTWTPMDSQSLRVAVLYSRASKSAFAFTSLADATTSVTVPLSICFGFLGNVSLYVNKLPV